MKKPLNETLKNAFNDLKAASIKASFISKMVAKA